MTLIGFTFTALVAMVLIAVTLSPVLAAAVVLYCQRAKRRAEHYRLAFDADTEHAALMGGDTATGTYGRYRP